MRHWGGWLLLVATAGACRYDETAVPPGREEIVVHAVLDPGRLRHFVLLERVLTGRTPVTTQAPFDSLDPISSRGGAPVSSALVVVYGPSGDSAVVKPACTNFSIGPMREPTRRFLHPCR